MNVICVAIYGAICVICGHIEPANLHNLRNSRTIIIEFADIQYTEFVAYTVYGD
jgi:hypothetical protein